MRHESDGISNGDSQCQRAAGSLPTRARTNKEQKSRFVKPTALYLSYHVLGFGSGASAHRPTYIVLLGSASVVADPFEPMKFSLIYDGDLPAGDGKRVVYASKVRNALHAQMSDLWDSHVLFRQLARTARAWPNGAQDLAITNRFVSAPMHDGPIPPVPAGMVDLCAPITIPKVGRFLPAVRDSLHLACSIDLLFLRHEEPMHIFRAGGDLDNRIKCFFDGLRMPNQEEGLNGEAPTGDPLYCLLEDDRLISDFSVRTGRLLGDRTKARHGVRIQADVTIKVLRINDLNQCLIGG
jgi:hypothetical protein